MNNNILKISLIGFALNIFYGPVSHSQLQCYSLFESSSLLDPHLTYLLEVSRDKSDQKNKRVVFIKNQNDSEVVRQFYVPKYLKKISLSPDNRFLFAERDNLTYIYLIEGQNLKFQNIIGFNAKGSNFVFNNPEVILKAAKVKSQIDANTLRALMSITAETTMGTGRTNLINLADRHYVRFSQDGLSERILLPESGQIIEIQHLPDSSVQKEKKQVTMTNLKSDLYATQFVHIKGDLYLFSTSDHQLKMVNIITGRSEDIKFDHLSPQRLELGYIAKVFQQGLGNKSNSIQIPVWFKAIDNESKTEKWAFAYWVLKPSHKGLGFEIEFAPEQLNYDNVPPISDFEKQPDPQSLN